MSTRHLPPRPCAWARAALTKYHGPWLELGHGLEHSPAGWEAQLSCGRAGGLLPRPLLGEQAAFPPCLSGASLCGAMSPSPLLIRTLAMLGGANSYDLILTSFP